MATLASTRRRGGATSRAPPRARVCDDRRRHRPRSDAACAASRSRNWAETSSLPVDAAQVPEKEFDAGLRRRRARVRVGLAAGERAEVDEQCEELCLPVGERRVVGRDLGGGSLVLVERVAHAPVVDVEPEQPGSQRAGGAGETIRRGAVGYRLEGACVGEPDATHLGDDVARRRVELHERRAHVDLRVGSDEDRADPAGERCGDRHLHLHALDHRDRVAGGDRCAGRDRDRDHHGGDRQRTMVPSFRLKRNGRPLTSTAMSGPRPTVVVRCRRPKTTSRRSNSSSRSTRASTVAPSRVTA